MIPAETELSAVPRRVFAVAPMPPESSAYALARYSRSPDSIKDSIAWVRSHDSAKFLESFYFQYGHGSIADLGHLVLCFEGISELAATEIEDEQVWDGQARSSRYQDFSKSPCVVPPGLSAEQTALFQATCEKLIAAYRAVHAASFQHLTKKLPLPEGMKPEAYERNLKARAFDVARYLLPFATPTGVGQVTSIRTLERQIRRLRASEYPELRQLGDEAAAACAASPEVMWETGNYMPPLAPTLAKYVNKDEHLERSTADLQAWAQANLSHTTEGFDQEVEIVKPFDTEADIAATLLYPVTQLRFRTLYEMAQSWPHSKRRQVIDVALHSRGRHDELLRPFRTATYAFDMVMDIGAYRDLHRHRRVQQFRQTYLHPSLGFATPQQVADASCGHVYSEALESVFAAIRQFPEPASHYLLPFAARGRFLFKMDFAEAEYIAKLRSGVKGHFSYRRIAWLIKQELAKLEPALADYLSATDPEIEDPLTR